MQHSLDLTSYFPLNLDTGTQNYVLAAGRQLTLMLDWPVQRSRCVLRSTQRRCSPSASRRRPYQRTRTS